MAIVNQSKISSSIANATKIDIGESWSSITTTYASETRQWQQFVSLIDNVSRVTSSISNVAKPA